MVALTEAPQVEEADVAPEPTAVDDVAAVLTWHDIDPRSQWHPTTLTTAIDRLEHYYPRADVEKAIQGLTGDDRQLIKTLLFLF